MLINSNPRRLARAALESQQAGRAREVELANSALEGLAFLLWRHLEHFLLYSGAAGRAGPATPFQQAAAVHRPGQAGDLGLTSLSHRADFSTVGGIQINVY